MRYWVLDGQTPRPATFEEWAVWFSANSREREVALTEFPCCDVSTVFIGCAMHHEGMPPQLFETALFTDGERPREHVDVVGKAADWDSAVVIHDQIVARVAKSIERKMQNQAKD